MAEELRIEFEDLKKLTKKLEGLHDEVKPLKIAAMSKLADEMRAAVNAGTKHGTVQGWQHAHAGSGGGYAAVHAMERSYYQNAKPDHISRKSYAYGYMTNSTNTGHKIRKPSGKAKSYRSRINVGYVHGEGYYQSAEGRIQSLAKSAEEKLAKEIEGLIEG